MNNYYEGDETQGNTACCINYKFNDYFDTTTVFKQTSQGSISLKTCFMTLQQQTNAWTQPLMMTLLEVT